MILKIIFRNLVHKPWNALLSLLLLTLSVAIISLLMLANEQVQNKLDKDLKNIDLVVGAKGSPLQLVLSSIYHVDAPTGNIPLEEAEKIAEDVLVDQAIPLSYGDSYKGYRILGTTPAFFTMYEATTAQGGMFEETMEVVIGAQVAQRTGLKVGSTFHGTHGEGDNGHVHEDMDYKVTGILAPAGNVIDQLIITSVNSVWDIHNDHAEESANEAPEAPRKEITALLVSFHSPMGIMSLPRRINANTSMQAVVPSLEINRLLNMMGVGIAAIQGIALAIMVIAGISVFVALYNRLKERKYEHALLRTMGSSRGTLLGMLLAEGLLLSIAGYVLGMLLSRAGISMLNTVAQKDFRFQFSTAPVAAEGWLFIVTIFIGIFAALLPAIKAYRLNIAKTLGDA